jgi:hypothetical protein
MHLWCSFKSSTGKSSNTLSMHDNKHL